MLSSILLLPSFGNIIIYTNFKINQDEIAKTICIQRKVANNTCNGLCELRKSLKKYDDNEKKMQNILKDKIEVVYIQNATELDLSIFSTIELKDSPTFLFEKKPIAASNFIFHPPLYSV